MPVSSMIFFGSRSAKAGDSRWIAQWSEGLIESMSASSGSPITL